MPLNFEIIPAEGLQGYREFVKEALKLIDEAVELRATHDGKKMEAFLARALAQVRELARESKEAAKAPDDVDLTPEQRVVVDKVLQLFEQNQPRWWGLRQNAEGGVDKIATDRAYSELVFELNALRGKGAKSAPASRPLASGAGMFVLRSVPSNVVANRAANVNIAHEAAEKRQRVEPRDEARGGGVTAALAERLSRTITEATAGDNIALMRATMGALAVVMGVTLAAASGPAPEGDPGIFEGWVAGPGVTGAPDVYVPFELTQYVEFLVRYYSAMGITHYPAREVSTESVFRDDPFLGGLLRAHDYLKRHIEFCPTTKEIALDSDHVLYTALYTLAAAFEQEARMLSPDTEKQKIGMWARVGQANLSVHLCKWFASEAANVYNGGGKRRLGNIW